MDLQIPIVKNSNKQNLFSLERLSMDHICPLCRHNSTSLYTNQLRFEQQADVLRCSHCSLIYLDQNSFQFPADFYETQYHQTYLTHIDPEILDPDKYYQKMQKASAIWTNKIKGMLSGTETVLDIGCSTGHLLTGIQDSAAAVFGHELSRKEVEFCQKKLGLNVDSKPLEERFPPQSFDLITLIFVLEHIGEPISFLQNLKKYLKPNGKLVIVVPNILDPLVSLYDIENFRKFYFCIEHLFYYSPKTLAETLTQAGYSSNPVCVQEYPITNHLNWIYCQKPRETLSARSTMPDIPLVENTLQNELEQFWQKTNKDYQELLVKSGFGDRVFCVAEVKND